MRIGRRVCELTLVWLEGRKVCKGEQSIYQKTKQRIQEKEKRREKEKQGIERLSSRVVLITMEPQRQLKDDHLHTFLSPFVFFHYWMRAQ